MLYTPLLPGAASGTLEPRHVVVPLLVDWNIGLLFGRDPAELGGLGPARPLGAISPPDAYVHPE